MLVMIEDAAVVPLTIRRVASQHQQTISVTFYDTTGETSDATYRLQRVEDSVAIYHLQPFDH